MCTYFKKLFFSDKEREKKNDETSFNDGSVDSRIDEKRSQLCYLPRIADAQSGKILNAQRRWVFPSAHLVQGC